MLKIAVKMEAKSPIYVGDISTLTLYWWSITKMGWETRSIWRYVTGKHSIQRKKYDSRVLCAHTLIR